MNAFHHSRVKPTKTSSDSTSWNSVAPWYSQLVGTQGHYYHSHVILPKVMGLISVGKDDSLVDFGCGQGVLAARLPKSFRYLGLDVASTLIEWSQKHYTSQDFYFKKVNLSIPLRPPTETHNQGVFILSLQNMKNPLQALRNASMYLSRGGRLIIVLNHPCFRIPRQSGWGIAETSKLQYRWINRYLSPLEIPITMNPGKGGTSTTWSFHHSLSDYSAMLKEAGFFIDEIQEWASDKESEGKVAKMENRARSEFPLFLTVVAQKK